MRRLIGVSRFVAKNFGSTNFGEHKGHTPRVFSKSAQGDCFVRVVDLRFLGVWRLLNLRWLREGVDDAGTGSKRERRPSPRVFLRKDMILGELGCDFAQGCESKEIRRDF
jgi:hypothetical protein